ncbi:hypothetical protein BDY24DRAFT_403182 [Mrakia frigida]|uniref:uncharacterized protein n=1 Tax=Mrakia frigida TaxID=29902 RepID=UPI003FCC20E0
MAPRNLSFSPSPSPLTQLGDDTPTSSNPEPPTPSSSFLPPPPPPPVEQAQLPPPPAPAPKPRKKKPSVKAAVDSVEGAVEEGASSGSPSATRGGKGKGRGGGRGGGTAGKGSRGGKKALKPAAELGELSNKYKDKFVELRFKYDEVNATKEANLATLNEALARLEKVQTENDAFLSSFITNIHTHPSLAYYLERSKTPPPEAMSSLQPAPSLLLPQSCSSTQNGQTRAPQDAYAVTHAKEGGTSSTSSFPVAMPHPRDESNGHHEDERIQKRARIE